MNKRKSRDRILEISHRWYIVLVFVLLGALIGWLASFIWPSPYRATINIYVGINPYRSQYDSYAESLAGQSFRLVDDYKNWQMEQLEELVLSDMFLEKTLNNLKMQDVNWETVSVDEFRSMTVVLWRNAGEWHLVVESDDSETAVQAVETWESVILENVNLALDHSKQVVALDINMTTLAESLLNYELRQEELSFARSELLEWQDVLGRSPQNQNITPYYHWKIIGAVAQVAVWEPVWNTQLNAAPSLGSLPEAYLLWIEGILASIDEEMALIPTKISQLKKSFAASEDQYKNEAAASYGLASTLVVEELQDQAPVVEIVRPQGTMILVGFIIGLFSWALWGFRQIDQKN